MGANISNTNVTNANTIISGGSSSYEAGTKVSPTNTIAPDVSAQINPLFTFGEIDEVLLNGEFIDEIVKHAFNECDYGYESYDGYKEDFNVLCTRLGIFRTENERAAGMVSINVNGLKSITQNLSTVNNTLEKIFSDDVSSKNKEKFKDDMSNVLNLYDSVWDQSKDSGTGAIVSNFSKATNDQWVPLISEEYFDNPGGYNIEKRGILDIIGSSQFKKIASNIFSTVTAKNQNSSVMVSNSDVSKTDGVRTSKSDALIKGEAMINLSSMVSGLMSMTRTNAFCEMLETKSNAAIAAFTSSSPNIMNTPVVKKALTMLNDMTSDVRESAINHLYMSGSKYNVKVATKDNSTSKTVTNTQQPDTNFLQSLVNCTPTVNGLLGIDVRKNKEEFSSVFIGTDIVEMMAASPTKVRLTSVDNYALYTSKNIDDVFLRSKYPYVCNMTENSAYDEYKVLQHTPPFSASTYTFKVPPVPNSGYTHDAVIVAIQPQAYAKKAIHDAYDSEISLTYRISGPGDMSGFYYGMFPSVIIGTSSGMYYLPMVAEEFESYTNYGTTSIIDVTPPVDPVLPIIPVKPDPIPEKPDPDPIIIIKPPVDPEKPITPPEPIKENHKCPTLPLRPSYVISGTESKLDYVELNNIVWPNITRVFTTVINRIPPVSSRWYNEIMFTNPAGDYSVLSLKYYSRVSQNSSGPQSFRMTLFATPQSTKYGLPDLIHGKTVTIDLDTRALINGSVKFSIIRNYGYGVYIVVGDVWYSVKDEFVKAGIENHTACLDYFDVMTLYTNPNDYQTFQPPFQTITYQDGHVCTVVPPPTTYIVDSGERSFPYIKIPDVANSNENILLSTLVVHDLFKNNKAYSYVTFNGAFQLSGSSTTAICMPLWIEFIDNKDNITVNVCSPLEMPRLPSRKDFYDSIRELSSQGSYEHLIPLTGAAMSLAAKRLDITLLVKPSALVLYLNDMPINLTKMFKAPLSETINRLSSVTATYVTAMEKSILATFPTVDSFQQNRTDPSKLTTYTNTYRINFSTKYLTSKKITEYFKLMSNSRPNEQWHSVAYQKPELMTPFSFAIGLVSTAFNKGWTTSAIESPLKNAAGQKFYMSQLSVDITSCPKNYSKHLKGWVFDNNIIDKPIISFMTLSDPFVQRTTSPIDVHVIWAGFVSKVAYYIPKVVDIINTSNDFLPVLSGFSTEYQNSLLKDTHYSLTSMNDVKQFLSDALFDMPNWLVYRSGSPLCSFDQSVIPKVAWSLITMLTAISQYSIYTHSALSTITSASSNMPSILGLTPGKSSDSMLFTNQRNYRHDQTVTSRVKMGKTDVGRLGLDVARMRGSLQSWVN